MRMRLTNSTPLPSADRGSENTDLRRRKTVVRQAALPPRGGPMLEQVCAENNFLLFDYGVHVADKPDF